MLNRSNRLSFLASELIDRCLQSSRIVFHELLENGIFLVVEKSTTYYFSLPVNGRISFEPQRQDEGGESAGSFLTRSIGSNKIL